MRHTVRAIALIVLVSAGAVHAKPAVNGLRTNGIEANGLRTNGIRTNGIDVSTPADRPSLRQLASRPLAR